jgi:hypothetical protein
MTDCNLTVSAFGIIECSNYGIVLQDYKYLNISKYGIDNKELAFFIEVNGRKKMFISSNYLLLYANCKDQLSALIAEKDFSPLFIEMTLKDIVNERSKKYGYTGVAVSVYDVSKVSQRSIHPIPRQMHITEEFIVEKDSSGFQCTSYQNISSVYTLVRSWNNPREFTVEYTNGSSRTYTCAVRDTLLATLLDACHAVGNVKVIVTGELSDNLRLMPRHSAEDYHSSIKDTFFGSTSIESFLLNRIICSCKTTPVNSRDVGVACRLLNANMPCPGIHPNTDLIQVKGCLVGILITLRAEVLEALDDER